MPPLTCTQSKHNKKVLQSHLAQQTSCWHWHGSAFWRVWLEGFITAAKQENPSNPHNFLNNIWCLHGCEQFAECIVNVQARLMHKSPPWIWPLPSAAANEKPCVQISSRPPPPPPPPPRQPTSKCVGVCPTFCLDISLVYYLPVCINFGFLFNLFVVVQK